MAFFCLCWLKLEFKGLRIEKNIKWKLKKIKKIASVAIAIDYCQWVGPHK